MHVERGAGKVAGVESGESPALPAGYGVPFLQHLPGEGPRDNQCLGAHEVARIGTQPGAGRPGARCAGQGGII